MSQTRIPENTGLTGKDRFTLSVHKTRIVYELHALALSATLRRNANLPVPAQWEHWTEDLRRGRLSVGGAVMRFFDMIAQRQMGVEGRALADQVMALLREYMELTLPAEPRVLDVPQVTQPDNGIAFPLPNRPRPFISDKQSAAR